MKAVPFGLGATFVDLEIDGAPDRAARTIGMAAALREALPDADVILGAGTVVVVGASIDAVRAVASGPVRTGPPRDARAHVIDVAYDGPDLPDVAEALGISVEEAIARHAATEHMVELLGFMPGFAYLAAPGGAPLPVPRRPTPRPRVPAGSVAVAASFSGIYPFASPGGWNLIGRAVGMMPFDLQRDPPMLFAPGDRVRFVPVDPLADARGSGPLADARGSDRAELLVAAAPACATVQDHGRIGQLGRGMPPSGPLDPEAFAAANAAVGNIAGAAVIEIPLGALEVEARGAPLLVSVDGEPARSLAPGDRLRVPTGERAVRYLAVRGGIAVRRVLGSRATLLVAGIGKPLRRRDALPIGDEIEGPPREAPPRGPAANTPLEIDPGPHLDRFPRGAYEALLAGAWHVSRLGDRVGVRLEGARVPREGPSHALPAPMIRGAVEIVTDGTPIVLGPDHPVTGGYPVLAVLRSSAQTALARAKPGDPVRFVEGR